MTKPQETPEEHKAAALAFANALGRREIAKAVAVKATAVSNAVVRGWFPSSWYLACKNLADEKGLDCPPSLFGMKASSSQDVNVSLDDKGVAA